MSCKSSPTVSHGCLRFGSDKICKIHKQILRVPFTPLAYRFCQVFNPQSSLCSCLGLKISGVLFRHTFTCLPLELVFVSFHTIPLQLTPFSEKKKQMPEIPTSCCLWIHSSSVLVFPSQSFRHVRQMRRGDGENLLDKAFPTVQRKQKHSNCYIHPSILFFSLFMVESRRKPSPDSLPRPSYKAFPGQRGYKIPPVSSGSDLKSFPSGWCSELVQTAGSPHCLQLF